MNEENTKYLSSFLSNYKATTGKWKLEFLRLTEDNTMALAIFHYYSDNQMYKLTAVRNLSETKSFYAWKILH
jgi:hypothetical protein